MDNLHIVLADELKALPAYVIDSSEWKAANSFLADFIVIDKTWKLLKFISQDALLDDTKDIKNLQSLNEQLEAACRIRAWASSKLACLLHAATPCKNKIDCEQFYKAGDCKNFHFPDERQLLKYIAYQKRTEDIRLRDITFYKNRYIATGHAVHETARFAAVLCSLIRDYCCMLSPWNMNEAYERFVRRSFPLFQCQCNEKECENGENRVLRPYPIHTLSINRNYHSTRMKMCVVCDAQLNSNPAYLLIEHHPVIPFQTKCCFGFYSLRGVYVHEDCAREWGFLSNNLQSDLKYTRTARFATTFVIPLQNGHKGSVFAIPLNIRSLLVSPRSQYKFILQNRKANLQMLPYCECANLQRCTCGILS